MARTLERMLITGASRGVGRAIAERLAEPGREIVLHGRDEAALAETAAQVERRGASARIVTADFARPEQVQRMADSLAGSELYALVNNAGVAVVKPVEQVTLDEWQQQIAVTLTAPFLLIQRLLPCLPRGASIVNVLSVAARQGFAGWSAYCAAKFALDGFSQSLREELRPRGVRVISVYPAATDTRLWNDVAGTWERARMLPPAAVADTVAFVLSQPAAVAVESITVGDVSGPL